MAFLPGTANAQPLKQDPASTITLKKGDGEIGVGFSYKRSTDFFDSGGSRKNSSDTAFPNGAAEKYHDFITTFSAAYGITDAMTLWFSFPIVFREETLSFDAEDWGFGDVRAGARYRFWKSKKSDWETAFEFSAKFPSGDGNIEFTDATTGRKSELPLGSGNTDMTPTLIAKKKFLNSRLSVEGLASYTIRFDALVEYLRTPLVAQTTTSGAIVVLPVGNLEIDWGDEINFDGRVSWKALQWLTLATNLHYFYRRPTLVRNFVFTTTAGAFDSTRDNIVLNDTHVLFAKPSLTFKVHPSIQILSGVEIPVIGKNFPTLSFVDSLVGNRYFLEVRYDF